MKFIKVFAAASIVMLAVACNGQKAGKPAEGTTADGKENVDPQSLLPKKGEVDSVSYLVGINFGSFLKGYQFGKLNYAQVKKGMEDFLNAKGNQNDTNFVKQFKINPEEMQDIINAYLQKMQDYKMAVNKQKEDSFFAENAKKEGVKTTGSGLQYIIEDAGSAVKPGPEDTVLVFYEGKTLDGTVFDAVKEDPDTSKHVEPARLILNRVIKGWQEGMQLIGEGGKIKLFVPAALGYGERGGMGIEPNSTLQFEVTLKKVMPFVATATDPNQAPAPGQPAIK